MRIAIQLWLGFVLAIVLVLGTGVGLRVREERANLLVITLRDRRVFAHALKAALSREHGVPDPVRAARAMLGDGAIAEAHIDARLVSPARVGGLPLPGGGEAARRAVLRGEVYVAVRDEGLITLVPVEAEGPVALELTEWHAVDALLSRIGLRAQVVQSLALVLLAGLSTLGLVRALVGEPLARLTALSRSIAAGDLQARVPAGLGGAEVAVLGREMNHMAERLQQAKRALEESEAERVAALEMLRHEDRLRTAGQLSSTLAHELGTPLNVVTGHARMLEEVCTDAAARESARAILEQGARMTRILRDLLDFTRRRGAQRSPRSLLDLARDAARTLRPLTQRQQVDIVVEGDAVRVDADGQQLLQVITNLVMNATQATAGRGEVRVRVDALEATPPTGVHGPAGRYARLTVSDRGVGIPEEDLARLFEPFFTRRAEGTGLGLAVVEGIVRDHQGWVAVRSSSEEGTRFEVYLPAIA
ncbi:MAG: ATP-binding protein [Polyangiales bacterium]